MSRERYRGRRALVLVQAWREILPLRAIHCLSGHSGVLGRDERADVSAGGAQEEVPQAVCSEGACRPRRAPHRLWYAACRLVPGVLGGRGVHFQDALCLERVAR